MNRLVIYRFLVLFVALYVAWRSHSTLILIVAPDAANLSGQGHGDAPTRLVSIANQTGTAVIETAITTSTTSQSTDTLGNNGTNHSMTMTTWPFAPSMHYSVEESLQRLTYLGERDNYDGGGMRCIKDPYRTPQLYWYNYNVTAPSFSPQSTPLIPTRRLLIVQSAGFGTYAQLLESTAPLNKAYARKWGQTMLVLQGTLVWLREERQRHCSPPEHRSTHNKMQLLNFGLSLKEHYDYLLILDADAMIYDFAKDLSDLMPPTALLAANKAVPKKGVKKRATWKINAGVTLWNLHHPLTQAVADGWREAALGYLNGRNNNQGDQLFLYHVLKNNATMEENVYALSKDFNYNKATVIKHIKRPKVTYEIGQTHLDSRAQVIEQFQTEICQQFPKDCQDLDRTPYSTF